MTFHTDVEYFKNVYFFLNYVSRSVQVSADALRSQRNWSPWTRATRGCELPNMGTRNQTHAFWKSRMHSIMEPSFPSWFCTIFSVCSMYNMCGVCECMYPCTHMEKPEQDSRNWVSLWTGSSPLWPDWLVDWGTLGSYRHACLSMWLGTCIEVLFAEQVLLPTGLFSSPWGVLSNYNV